MIEKIKQKAFIQIPVVIGIVFAIIITSAGAGVFFINL